MRKPILYAIAAFVVLLAVSCSTEETGLGAESGKGVLKMNISTTRVEEDGEYNPLDHITVRIFNSEGGLLRKYSSSENIPERLELLQGTYRVAVEAGEAEAASLTKRFYIGEKQFEVVAGTTTPVEVRCKIQNTVADVKFDKTVTTNFGEAFYTWVAIGSQVDEAEAALGNTPALRFTANAKGYFTLPEGETSLAWKFVGEHPSRGQIVKEGVLTELKGGSKYALTFHFSKDLPGFIACFAILVDTSTDDQDDTIIFSPDPVIDSEGFDMTQTQDFIVGKTGDKTYKITTMAPMQSVTLRIDDAAYDLFGPTAAPVEGITATPESDNILRVTLSGPFFAEHSGGNHTLLLLVADNDGGSLISESPYRLQGMLPVEATDCDLWHNTATMRALILDPEVAGVTFGLRTANGEWREADGTKDDDGIFTATFAAEWSQSTNENNLTVYTPVAGTGLFAATAYEGRTTIGDTQSVASFTTPAGDGIYNAGMEMWSNYNVTGSSMTGGSVPFPNENSSTAFWVGGNNKQTNTLCTEGFVEGCNGSKCAKLQPMAVAGIFAAGNLFTGTFDCGTGFLDMFGYARFGQKYTFTARPKALRIHYNATITNVTHTGGPLQSGIDPGKIFVCITNWTGRHAVKSGKTYDESTFWDPAKTTSLGEGPILGYASKTITESTSGWQTLELPILWYDNQATPSANNYSLSISCATSAYGDYVAGSTNNRLYVEDFEWVY